MGRVIELRPPQFIRSRGATYDSREMSSKEFAQIQCADCIILSGNLHFHSMTKLFILWKDNFCSKKTY